MAGRPRSAECDRAILDAALSEYAAARARRDERRRGGGARGREQGDDLPALSEQGRARCAARRRWRAKNRLRTPTPARFAATSRAILRTLRHNLDDPLVGAAKRKLLFDASYNDELARMHKDLVRRRRETDGRGLPSGRSTAASCSPTSISSSRATRSARRSSTATS